MDPLLLRGLLAAVLGAVAMTLSSSTEMYLRERPPSETPGEAGNKLLGLVGLPRQTGQRLTLLSTWVHWIYSTIWGVVLWLLVDPELGGLRLATAAPVFFALVWGIALGIAGPGIDSSFLAVGPQGSGDRCLAPRRLCHRHSGGLVAHRSSRVID